MTSPSRTLGARWGLPSTDDQARLRAGFGAALATERARARLTQAALARRALVARSTVRRLEHGQRRPRPIMVRALALGLDPDDPQAIAERLTEAAGALLAPDTAAGLTRRERVARKAWREGRAILPTRAARLVAACRAVDAATAALDAHFALTDQSARLMDDPAWLARCFALHDHVEAARRVVDQLGGPVATDYGTGPRGLVLIGAGIR